MKKIPTLFKRNESDRRYVTREINPGCEWVIEGQGVALRKYDGTCVMYDGDRWWVRREVKPGKATPQGFIESEFDQTTGKTVGWEPADQSGFAKWLDEARGEELWAALTFELCGPRVNGNPEHYDRHILVPHVAAEVFEDVPRDFDGIAGWLHGHDFEGIVFHHPDGRMCKIKTRDFPA